jgi:hypothetical protein
MLALDEADMGETIAKVRRRTYPMNNLDILNVVYLENLAESLNVRAHSHKRARHRGVVLDMETDGTRITQRKIHRGRTGLRRSGQGMER